MYRCLIVTFLNSDVAIVRMEAIKTISFILHSDIEKSQEFDHMQAARQSKKELFNNILTRQKIQYSENDVMDDVEGADQLERKISSYIQLFSSLFCASFVLRKTIIFEMSKLVLRYKLSGEIASRIFKKIVIYLKCDAESLMDTNSLVHLIMQWQHICYKFDK